MRKYGLGDKSQDIQRLQRYLNEVLTLDMKPDGAFGKVTQSALKRLQDRLAVTEKDADGAFYGPITQSKILETINKKYLTEQDYIDAASKLGVETNVVKTVTAVEALQFGFQNNGSVVMLFERHVFYQRLRANKGEEFAKMVSSHHPDVCNPAPGGYLGGGSEMRRLDRARVIDEECALMSASYGLFQIMGFNYRQAGYSTVKDYFEAMKVSEKNQLNAFVNYVARDKDKSLLVSLKHKDFTSFAKEYNGPGYRNHKEPYDDKMRRIYRELSTK